MLPYSVLAWESSAQSLHFCPREGHAPGLQLLDCIAKLRLKAGPQLNLCFLAGILMDDRIAPTCSLESHNINC